MDLELPMVTAEDLIVAKLEWARAGASDLQLRDALAVLLQRGRDLDRAYIERWVGELGLDREWAVVLEEVKRQEYLPWRPSSRRTSMSETRRTTTSADRRSVGACVLAIAMIHWGPVGPY